GLIQQQVPLSDESAAYALEQEKKGNTEMFVATETAVIGVISIADEIRPEAPEALRQLRKAGIELMVILTGDNQSTANLVASQLDIDQVYGELLPEAKVKKVKACIAKGKRLGMVG